MENRSVVDCSKIPDLDGRIIIDNYGWGPIENASTTIRFSRKKQAPGDGSRAAEVDLKTFNDYQTIKVTPLLQQFGVNTTALRTDAKGCPSKSAVPGCIRKMAASGIFGGLTDHLYAEDRYAVTDVVGNLKYEWTDTVGQRHSQASPYRVTIPVFGFTVPESPECGAAGPSVYSDRKIDLPLDQVNYRVNFDLPASVRVLKPKQQHRFGLVIDSAKSSMHSLKLVLQLSDGQRIESLPLMLDIFKFRDDKPFAKDPYFSISVSIE